MWGSWVSDPDDHTVIHLLEHDTSLPTHYLFGAMRRERVDIDPGEQCHFFKIGLLANNHLDTSNFSINKINNVGGFFNKGFVVLGIRKKMSNNADEIDMVLFNN